MVLTCINYPMSNTMALINRWVVNTIDYHLKLYEYLSMDWFSRENLNRKPMGFYHQIAWAFHGVSGSNFPIIQFCESPFIVDMLIHYMGQPTIWYVWQSTTISTIHNISNSHNMICWSQPSMPIDGWLGGATQPWRSSWLMGRSDRWEIWCLWLGLQLLISRVVEKSWGTLW